MYSTSVGAQVRNVSGACAVVDHTGVGISIGHMQMVHHGLDEGYAQVPVVTSTIRRVLIAARISTSRPHLW